MVNTFIPYKSFRLVAKKLDYKRLGKQRVEAKQILNILLDDTKTRGWRNHPVVAMWRGYEGALKYYYNCMVSEWVKRGYNNTMKFYKLPDRIIIPWFVSCKTVRLSHQASLLRKHPAYYEKIFDRTKIPKEYFNYSYVWPGGLSQTQINLLKSSPDKCLKIDLFAKKFVPQKS